MYLLDESIYELKLCKKLIKDNGNINVYVGDLDENYIESMWNDYKVEQYDIMPNGFYSVETPMQLMGMLRKTFSDKCTGNEELIKRIVVAAFRQNIKV